MRDWVYLFEIWEHEDQSKLIACVDDEKKIAFRALFVQVTESSFQLIGVAVIEFYSSLNPPH